MQSTETFRFSDLSAGMWVRFYIGPMLMFTTELRNLVYSFARDHVSDYTDSGSYSDTDNSDNESDTTGSDNSSNSDESSRSTSSAEPRLSSDSDTPVFLHLN